MTALKRTGLRKIGKNLIKIITRFQKTKFSPDGKLNTLHKKLIDNLKQINQLTGKDKDWVIRSFYVGKNRNILMGIIYIAGLADKEYIFELTSNLEESLKNIEVRGNTIAYIKKLPLLGSGYTEVTDFETLCQHAMSGDIVIMLDGYTTGLAVPLGGSEGRSISEPSSQPALRGPRDGFVEKLQTNKTLIRKRIKNNNLRIETTIIGKVTNTAVAIMYIKGICEDKLVSKVRSRLAKIDIDGIIESGQIEEFIQDAPFSIFPTVLNTERPDTVVAELLNGRVAILVDGTPFVLIVPALFVQFFQACEDYYHGFGISSLIRILRFASFLLGLFVPSLYIALTTFHQEMIPGILLINIVAQREGVPFPTFIEVLLMEAAYEILREASIRMPKTIGSALSVVGGLVIGQSAVQAGLVSEGTLIVVSITAIGSFLLPYYNMAIAVRVLRFALMFLSASFGLYGIFIGLMAILLHLCSLNSFGVPYMEPLAPKVTKIQRDAIMRLPLREKPVHVTEEDEHNDP
jgi:spore germination protein KA